uniref:Family with sequence similarity 83 member H n=1 Tax=Loxodonta africana TaxID=9785 RepID=G3U0R1_LOXAF
MARRSQSSSQGDNPLAPGYLPPHYKEYYRLAVDALAEGGPEAYNRFLASEGAPAFLCPEELDHVSRHLRPPQHAAGESPEGSPPDMDMDGSSGTYWPVNSDQAVPELDLGWPLTFGFQGTEVTTLVQPPPPESPSIKDEARRMIRSAQQVVAVVMDMFTDVDLLSEMLEAAARRVPVYILLDEMNAQHFLDMADKCRVNLHHVDFLRVRTVAGPTYYCRTGKSFKGHVKEKFLLVDCAVVMSGNYSFMWSFEKIHRSLAHVFQGELVSSFDEEFRILFAQSEPLVPSAGALARMDAYALAPYAGAGPLVGCPGPGAPTPFSFPKRAHLLFPPPREEGLGFPSFLDPDRHFLSAFRREEPLRGPGAVLEPHAGLRPLSRRLDAVFQARHLEMYAFRHSYAAAADGLSAVQNFRGRAARGHADVPSPRGRLPRGPALDARLFRLMLPPTVKALKEGRWQLPTGRAAERRSLETCLLRLSDFAQRLPQEGGSGTRGAATLTASQLLDTLGGADRLPSRFLPQGRGDLPAKGGTAPPLEGPGIHQVQHSELKGSPTSAHPECKGNPTPGLPTRRGSPTLGFSEQKGSPASTYPEHRGSPVAPVPERRGSPVPPVPERRSSPVPPVPERRGSLTLALAGGGPKGPADEPTGGPMEVLRKGSLRLRQLLSPKGERRPEEEGSFVPQENGQPESPRRPSLGRGDSTEAAAEERGPRARVASATANALYSSNLRDDTKAILEQISAHGQKHRGAPAPGPIPAHNSPDLGRPPASSGLAPDMSDKDKCSAIFRSDSFGAQGRLSRTLPATAEERDRLLRRMESMRKEKRVYSRFEVFCKKEDAGGASAGEGLAEEDARDSKVGKFMPKILGTFKGKK